MKMKWTRMKKMKEQMLEWLLKITMMTVTVGKIVVTAVILNHHHHLQITFSEEKFSRKSKKQSRAAHSEQLRRLNYSNRN